MDKSEGGFTLVEVLVSVFVASIVIGVLAQSYIYVAKSFEWRKLRSVAIMIANVNLERYKRIKKLKEAGFECEINNSVNKFQKSLTNKGDRFNEDFNLPEIKHSSINQKIVAYTTTSKGCDIRVVVESVVEYKNHPNATDVETVKQVIYAQ
jgi:hypothetical protein cdiviTM7_02904